MTTNSYLTREAKAFVKRKHGPDEVIRIIPDRFHPKAAQCYRLYTSFDEDPDELGCILFDAQGYWIYDGSFLAVTEQEQVADFIINYVERQ
ncbi:hypothetical protein ACFFGT_03115 [Mucilaginibacter angelicae]|uniref:Uncharacterized protein n=1 Tax=Mucilaginibacter angelicae TaxID=869718 RepID=A0ABV6L0C4_9SPHI